MNSTPDTSKANFIAVKLLIVGVRLPFSQSLTGESPRLEARASFSGNPSDKPRAARDCAAVMAIAYRYSHTINDLLDSTGPTVCIDCQKKRRNGVTDKRISRPSIFRYFSKAAQIACQG
jgi:hypothetical protein